MNAATTRRGGARGQLEPAAASGGVVAPLAGTLPARPPARPLVSPSATPVSVASRSQERLGLAAAFTVAALRYWAIVFPRVCRELSRWRVRAERIADPVLQRLALEALDKRANVEGAAAFAAFVPRSRRRAAVCALAAFQLAYDYVDLLAEQPSRDPVENARRLHSALLLALDPGAPHPDHYEHFPRREDGGYLEELLEDCREALAELPSHTAVASAARRAAARIVAFQSLSMGGRGQADSDERSGAGDPSGETRDGLDALRRCARAQTPPGSGLRWWETAAAGGSSLGVLALIAAAAQPAIDPREIAAIEAAYFPWIGACHSLLDSLVDREEDARIDQLSLIGCYADPLAEDAAAGGVAAECLATNDDAARMGWIAAQAMRHARELPRGRGQAVLCAAMAGFYLSDPRAGGADALPVCRAIRKVLGPLARPTLLVFVLRRRLGAG